ncbi:hypothetical protein NEOLEDRAFT_1159892 [Neolentinus lepideus HHB14362 ss-1]|uniref:BRCA2 OB1 domain-containing protein n=1 Tax=Neolentinus lepideus HHB14362 ss-1 TaxID=1314782 RepID=A0A165W7M9_9AGAM|nr:hypothetical protein NEOLEDRAFT_1159892 [Neolentinus lepideus HHB14362 ss-1]
MLEQLHAKGCCLATQEWVENHWSLILWKLAGMVCLDPKSESDSRTRRWCWGHILEQFLYRYEKELECGSRPPLRLIATQDTPASLPMVLCVSNITWSSGGADDDGLVTDPIPELELTDGWYKLRAEADGTLTRAIRKGKIRVGRKIGVQNARLSSDHKDPTEVLEAYDRCHLVLTGNSCHLVPWHAKLGFCNSPSFATLGRLTPDGGVVTIMDLTVVKTHPVAYVEFIEGPDGKTRKSVPRDEKEEMKVQDQWVKRREEMAAKWREDLDKKIRTLEGYAHRLEARAGCSQSKTEDEDPPVHIENYYDDLEETGDINSLLCRLSKFEMRCLSRIIHKNCTALREGASDEMEKDLAFECPPRKIRNFRVVVAKDSRTYKRDAYRKAQITVWDVMDLAFGEGTKAGAFAPNQRFIVTNLIPTQQGAWMGNEPDAEVYLTTRRDSRWTKIS